MTDAFSVTEDIKAVPERQTLHASRVYTPVPIELRRFFKRVKEAVRNSKPAKRITKAASRLST